jgi:hypothetical protein
MAQGRMMEESRGRMALLAGLSGMMLTELSYKHGKDFP